MTTYESMLAAYRNDSGSTATKNAEQEVCQKIALAGLHRGGFFDHAAFYGGTCLRMFYGLPRFSEDMDFSLTQKRDDIHLENYFDAIREEFNLAGFDITITKKEKKAFGKVESAFLKENTEAYDIKFQTKKTVKVKIELDTDPPLLFNTEQKLLMQPYSFMVRCFTLPDLYAGKMHALVYRAWQRRVKGRDWFDFEWYVRNGVPLSFWHLQERIREFNGAIVSPEEFMDQLRKKIVETDIEKVKQDVIPYIVPNQQRDLDIWSNEYFLMLVDKIVIGYN
ncbi:MAG: nucleotidyl transferase AbiEii/AbiGii toxin family protein [Bacteroidales bacterium]|nr:nucleotidyl transferase AbiEii/AbiGii toxin family protein [Bacteroidales bacterium]